MDCGIGSVYGERPSCLAISPTIRKKRYITFRYVDVHYNMPLHDPINYRDEKNMFLISLILNRESRFVFFNGIMSNAGIKETVPTLDKVP